MGRAARGAGAVSARLTGSRVPAVPKAGAQQPLIGRVTAKGLLTSRMGSSWVTEARRLAVEAAEDAAKVGSM